MTDLPGCLQDAHLAIRCEVVQLQTRVLGSQHSSHGEHWVELGHLQQDRHVGTQELAKLGKHFLQGGGVPCPIVALLEQAVA